MLLDASYQGLEYVSDQTLLAAKPPAKYHGTAAVGSGTAALASASPTGGGGEDGRRTHPALPYLLAVCIASAMFCLGGRPWAAALAPGGSGRGAEGCVCAAALPPPPSLLRAPAPGAAA